MTAPTTTCAHCGLPAPAVATGPSFCCRGCQSVWQLVHEAGLADYYTLRDRLTGDEAPGAARAEQAADEPVYAHLDDPDVQRTIGRDRPGSAELHLTGLHCAACVWLIERLPEVLPGVSAARVDFGSARLWVDWDPERIRLSQIAGFLHRAGYRVHAVDAEAEQARRSERRRELIRIAIAGASAGNVMLVSFALYAGSLQGMDSEWVRFFEWAAMLLALPAITWGALPFYRAAWAGLRMGKLHIDLPIALGVAGGFIASVIATIAGDPGDHAEVYFDSVSVLVFLLLIGRWIQRRGQQWALSRTDLLQRLLPAQARRCRSDGALEQVAASALRVGERIEVRPGERFPADARVLAGTSSVDASSLTGESLPLSVEVGDEVLAGTRNLHAPLELEVEAVGSDTRIGSLAARILEADRKRAPIQRAVDRITGVFVAAVLLLAIVGALAWWLIDPSRVFGVVVALLVISCPCALGLATPVALAVARARAAERGILLASAGALEALAKADTVVFDKTGTLTEGELRVRSLACSGIDEGRLAALLRAIEADSGHPIGQALRRWAEGSCPSEAIHLDTIEDLHGRGRSAWVRLPNRSAALLRVGSVAWIDPGGSLAAILEPALERGETAVLVELDGRVVAWSTLADVVRDDAASALARLRELGLELAIRSGDHPRTVAAIADQLRISDHAGSCSPEQKAQQLSERWAHAAMIGDGVNDATAMRAASVGVAVRGGAEVALRVADVHLARPGVAEVVQLFEGARRTMRVIRRNLGFSLVYNLVFASLALLGLIDPLVAAVLMPASGLTVVLSSTLARTFDSLPLDARDFDNRAPVSRDQLVHPVQSLHGPTTVRAS